MIDLWTKTKGWKLPVLAVASFTFALVSVLGRAEPPAKTPIAMPPMASFATNLAGIGVVEPKSETIAIGTELSGIVRTIHVMAGARVTKGTPLFSLDQRDIDAQIATLEASRASLVIQANEAATQFALVEGISDPRAVARDEYNRRKYAAALSKARIGEIEAQLNQARTTKKRLTILAPIDGTILDVNIRPGEFAAAGPSAQATTEPLMTIGDVSTLYVRVEFDEEIAADLKPTFAAKAVRRGNSAQSWPLDCVRIEPSVTPKRNLAVAGQRVDTRVVQVLYALPVGVTDILVGQQMDVFVDTGTNGQPITNGAKS